MKIKNIAKSALAVAVILSMTGCSTLEKYDINKEKIGTAVGAVGGGILCYAMLSKASTGYKVAGTSACALGGGLLGNAIGKTLDDRDKAELEARSQKALESSKPGVTTWKSSTTAATAKLEVSKPVIKKEAVSVKRNIEVQQVAQMTKINAPYLTTKGSNVRSAPSTSGSKLAFLPAKTEFQAIGQAGDWVAVGRNGVLVGYISKDLVESKAMAEARIAASAPPEMQKSEVVIVPALKLDKITAANEPELAKLVDQPVVAEKVEATTTCKTLKSTVTDKDGKTEESSTELCKKPEVNKWANA